MKQNQIQVQLHPHAALAIKAVSIRKQCGREAAARFAEKNGVRSLYRLALQLEVSTALL